MKNIHNQEAKVDGETTRDEQGAPVLLVTHVNNILHSISDKVEVYINNPKKYNSIGLYAHTFYISINFKGATSENKGVLSCEG